jgi:L-alanine-DL-glutamate epimerase-like enolase superfamily enzyme
MSRFGSDPVVERIAAAAYTIPTDAAEADGTLRWDSTTVVVARAYAGDEMGLGWSYASAAAARVIDGLLASTVCGRSALDVTAANDAMSKAVRNVGRQGIAATAISAVDIALWDLKARLLGVSIGSLLGALRPAVPIYGSGGFTTYDDDQTTRQVKHWIDECGIDMVKIKIGESWGSRVDRDLHRTELVRGLIGDRQLFVDANGGYDVGQAIRVGRCLDELDVRWFEEPVSSDDLPGLRDVRQALNADVAAGEYGYDLPYFHRMVAAGAVDCLQIDATRCGGITEFLRAAAVAAAANLEVSAHCAPHLHAAFVAAVPNLRHVEYFHDHVRIEEQLLFAGADPPSSGELIPVSAPGHGYTLREPDDPAWRVQ